MERNAFPTANAAISAAADALQSFGVVVLFDLQLRIHHVSQACEPFLGRSAEELIGRSLGEILDAADVEGIRTGLSSDPSGVGRRHLTVSSGKLKIRTFDPGAGLIGLDLLPLPDDYAGSATAAIERVSSWNEQLLEAESVDELISIATAVASERTGFDGTWICRTLSEDGTATVVSAIVPPATPTALGTLVEPVNMPPQSVRFKGRPIPYFVTDLSAPATGLHPPPVDADITGSSLLLPFPAWLRWLATVGPRATVGIPIVVGNALWGWILAHHPSARRVPASVQAELRLLGAATGTKMAELLSLEETRERLELSRASVRVLQAVAAADDLVTSLVHTRSAFPGICEADSAIVSIGERVDVAGAPLDHEVVDQVLDIACEELRANGAPVVSSRTLGIASAIDPQQAAGFAATRLDADADHIVVWVRGEQRRSVKWAQHAVVGDEPQEALFTGLGERVEEERGRCAPWTAAQLREISDLREALAEVFVARYGAMQSLTAELARSNEEYDAFAHAAAHDLKTPLRGIRQNIEFFLEDLHADGASPDEAMLHSAVRLTSRMSEMLEGLMTYAQVGQETWRRQTIDIAPVVDEVVELLGPRLDDTTVVVEPGTFDADPLALRQLLLNFVGNAAKYGGDADTILVRTVSLEEATSEVPLPAELAGLAPDTRVLAVSDQGIGIERSHHERIFDLFRQLDPDVPGGGVGLALCRLICRRGGGDVWLTSEPGLGTTFFAVAST